MENEIPSPSISEGRPPISKKSHALIWCTLIFFTLGILWFSYWFFYLQFHESTDDAYANGNRVFINSVVNGSVIAFYADDTDFVREGQLLVELDKTPFLIAYEKELAVLTSSVLQVRQIYDTVKAHLAFVESKKALVEKAQYDFENRAQLVDSLAVSNEEFIHAKDNLRIAKLELEQAKYQYEVSKDSAGITLPAEHPMILQQKNNVRQAYYNLKHCSIFSPCSGYIAQRTVEIGQSVSREKNLMVVIPMDYVWVDANFKETQLKKMRIGQPAKISLDLYGSSVEYEGKVLGIASGTGSVFSLIPPQNATGNWIKIVQRLPVRISLDAATLEKFPLRIGISAQVDVDVRDQQLPILATIPPKKAVSQTDIFTIDLDEVDQLMEEMIQKHLNHHPIQSEHAAGI